MLTDNEHAFLNRVLLGNALAVAFCEELFQVSQVWDDLYDEDKEVSKETLNRTFWSTLISLPNNPFYQQYFDVLNPLLQAAIVDWIDSNDLARGNREQKCAAFVLRDTLSSIVIHCARLVGGWDWMREISVEVREALYDEDSLSDFMEEHA